LGVPDALLRFLVYTFASLLVPKIAGAQMAFGSGPEQAMMGSCRTANTSVFGLCGQAASLQKQKGFAFGCAANLPFSVADLTTSSLHFGYRTNEDRQVGFQFFNQSFEGYLHQLAQAGLGIALNKQWRGGLAFGSAWQKIGSFNQAEILTNISATYTPNPKFGLVFTVNNVHNSAKKPDLIEAKTAIQTGLQYKPNADAFFLIELQKQWQNKWVLCFAIRYQLAKSLLISAGYNSLQGQIGLGLQIQLAKTNLMPAFALNSGLPPTPFFGLAYYAEKADTAR